MFTAGGRAVVRISCRHRCTSHGKRAGEAGRSAESAREASGLRRAKRPEKRALPEDSELPVQRAGETKILGFYLPRFCVSDALIHSHHARLKALLNFSKFYS